MEYVSTNIRSCIVKCVKYKRIQNEGMQTLTKKMEELRICEEGINKELQNLRKKEKNEVETWLENVKDKRSEVQGLEQKIHERRYFSRLQFLRFIEKNIEDVTELIEKGSFLEGLRTDFLEDQDGILKGTPLVSQSKIWDCLMKDETLRIGIYGTAGIGKTTIMTRIYKKLLESHTFDHVYRVTVSKGSDIHKLQGDIARSMQLDLTNKQDESKRATELLNGLRERKKFVLILDDMWKVFPLQEIGIPVGDDVGKLIVTSRSLEVCQEMDCQPIIKVEPLPTGEAWDLFMEKLGHKTVFAPEVEEIAKSIVKECAGLPLAVITTARSMRGVHDIHEWRKAFTELRESATGFTDMESEVFKLLKFSYDRLKDEKLQQCLLYCALFPEDYKIQRNYLVMCWIAEGLVDEKRTRQAEFDRGHDLLNKLENACLLDQTTDFNGEVCVKMHDVIRDMALNITKVNPLFMVKAGVQLKELPIEGEWSENLERVSLMGNDIEGQPSGISPKCPRLRTLMLQSNYNLKEIPNSFFVYMQSLGVLDLSDSRNIEHLPDSISNLEKLRALLLNGCYKLRYIPSLEKLTELRELDLRLTQIEELPNGMEKLVNLKRLDLHHTSRGCVFPSELLAKISRLQSLRLGTFKIADDVLVEKISSLRQQEVLVVPFFDLHLFNSYVKTQHWQRLSRYRLQTVSEHYMGSADEVCCKEVHVRGFNPFQAYTPSQSNIPTTPFQGPLEPLLLPTNVQELFVSVCNDLISLSNISSSLKSARELERCLIDCCYGMKEMWSWTSELSLEEESLLQSLRTLMLHYLPNLSVLFNLKGVGRAPPKCGTFSNLKLFSIGNCPNLKYVFTRGLLQHHLQNLETIHVYDCSKIEKIILAEEDENNSIICSKLQSLVLQGLPKLKSIWRGTMVCVSLQQIEVRDCPALKRLPLALHLSDDTQTSQTLQTLKTITGEQPWWDLLEWDHPDAKAGFQPQFETKKVSCSTCILRADEIWKPSRESTPSLQSEKVFCRELHMSSHNLTRGGGYSLVLPTNIQEVHITHCNHLRSLSNISSSLKNVKELGRCWIEFCQGIENLWSWSTLALKDEADCLASTNTSLLQGLDTLRLSSLPNLSVIFNFKGVGVGGAPQNFKTFSNLKRFSLGRCRNLKYVFTRGLVEHHLQNLEVIHVYECCKMENIIVAEEDGEEVVGGTDERSHQYSGSNISIKCLKLQSLELDSLRKLKSMWRGTLICPSLENIEVRMCPRLNRLPLPQTFPTPVRVKKISGQQAWWDKLEWDHPDAKSFLEPLFDTKETYLSGVHRAYELWRNDARRYEE